MVSESVVAKPSSDPAVGILWLDPRGSGTQLPEALQATANAFTNSTQVSYRSAGFLASARRITVSTGAASVELSRCGGAGSSRTILNSSVGR